MKIKVKRIIQYTFDTDAPPTEQMSRQYSRTQVSFPAVYVYDGDIESNVKTILQSAVNELGHTVEDAFKEY